MKRCNLCNRVVEDFWIAPLTYDTEVSINYCMDCLSKMYDRGLRVCIKCGKWCPIAYEVMYPGTEYAYREYRVQQICHDCKEKSKKNFEA